LKLYSDGTMDTCSAMRASYATVTDTAVVPQDTSAITVDSDMTPSVATMSPVTTWSDMSTVCGPLPPAQADFTASPTSGYKSLVVQFTDQSTTVHDTWLWDFGDGATSTAQNPLHTYTVAGDFTVSLTINGPGGEDTEVKDNYIHVSDPPCECDLVPDATVIPRGGTLGFQITVMNNTDQLQVFGFATKATKPGGAQTDYIIGPLSVRLDPYDSKSAHKSHPIPGNTPLGIYTYHGYVGTTAELYHECQFQFEVTLP
jgi:hypothetical protein